MTQQTFVIAEAGVNHNGSLAMALDLVRVAAEAGADAVKFQSFRSEELVSPDVQQCDYQARNAKAATQYEMLRGLELDEAAHLAIAEACRGAGIEFMSTAFDPISLDFLVERTGIRRIKIPSGELTNPVLLLAAARKGLPLIVSTGMADLAEIEAALKIIAFGLVHRNGEPSRQRISDAYAAGEGRTALARNVSLLHCTTAYPTPPEHINLRAMATMAEAFHLPVGLSDHSEGTVVSIAAAALGAVIIEKHFTLDRNLPGPDHAASLKPDELSAMIAGIRAVAHAQGDGRKAPTPVEIDNRSLVRRVLVAARDIAEGEILTTDAIALKRAGDGISAMEMWSHLGQPARRQYRENERID